jgi:transposase
MRTRKTYDEQFKADTVRLLMNSGRTVKDVAAELGVERSSVGRWRHEALVRLDGESKANGSTGMKPSEMDQEIKKLRREISYIREQRDILKKAISIFSRDGDSHMSS